jgi:lysophospholipase L1-like esterase
MRAQERGQTVDSIARAGNGVPEADFERESRTTHPRRHPRPPRKRPTHYWAGTPGGLTKEVARGGICSHRHFSTSSVRRTMTESADRSVYVALGDSISIDDYTGVAGGGAPAQLARTLGADLVDLTRDGNTTHGTLADLSGAPAAADLVTLTAGGNDLLAGDLPRGILRRLDQIAERIEPLGARVIVNTVYDPSDGDNEVGRRELGLSRLAALELRRRLNALNGGIRKLAAERGFLLADLERLFHGHGVASDEPWFVQVIEPNLAGATAIAQHWYELLT